jgi:two-component system nitrate/nitrite sensor histidine kinase NarX
MSQVHENPLVSTEEYRNIFEAASDGLVLYDIGLGSVLEANPAACQMHGYSRQEFIGLDMKVFIHIDSKTLLSEHVRTARPGNVFEALALHIRKDGSRFNVEERISVIVFRGRPCLLSIMRDVSQRIRTEKILGRQIEDQLREQATLLAISHTLASTLEFEPDMILDQLREIIEYTHCALFALEDSALVTMATRGTPQLVESSPVRIHLHGPETLAALFNGHKPIRIADIWSEDVDARFLRTLLDDSASVLLKGMYSWMWVPLAVKGRIIGGVGVAHEKRNFFTSHHADLALSVANQAAISMVNAELYKDAQKLGVLEERQNLARNLHDAINQSLFSAGLIAEVLPRLWEREPEEARRSLEDLRRLTRGALAEMRSLLVELRPSAITDTELGDLLQLLANAFTGRTNIPVAVTVAGDGTLPAEIQVELYRICQEALNNIAKHAKASQVKIDLQHDDSVFELYIRDDGRGFNTADQTPGGHYGLSMMRERAETVGATLTVTSQAGHGTEIAIRWNPIPKKEVK